MTGISREEAYSSALRIKEAFMTDFPSSEKPMAPASLRSQNSLRREPSDFTVIAAIG
jgi:hypothetical protein